MVAIGPAGAVSASGTFTSDTELPAAVTPADNMSNATAMPQVLAHLMGFDGTTWDRLGISTSTWKSFRAQVLSNALLDDGTTTVRGWVDYDGNQAIAQTAPFLFNSATYDKARNNVDATLLASAARTTTTNSADQTNYNGRGVKVVLDMTSVGTGSVTLTIQGKDALSGQYYTLLAGAAVTTNSVNVYTVFPGATVTANVSANDILPRTWRVNVVANNANSATYSVGCSVII